MTRDCRNIKCVTLYTPPRGRRDPFTLCLGEFTKSDDHRSVAAVTESTNDGSTDEIPAAIVPLGMSETLDKRFMDFVLFQAQNAGLFLGKIPNPATGQTSINIRAAQSVLDSLEMLQDKTKGNLITEEQAFLDKAVTNIETLLEAAENGELGNDEEE